MNTTLCTFMPQFMIFTLFTLGVASAILGLLLLTQPNLLKEQDNILTQAGRLAQKGLAEEVSGLVGNTSNLLNSINEMTKTRRGTGSFMALFGAAMVVLAVLLWQGKLL